MKVPFDEKTELGNYKHSAIYKAPLMTFYAENYMIYYDISMWGGPYGVRFNKALVFNIDTPHPKSGFVGITSIHTASGEYDKIEDITDQYSEKEMKFFNGLRKLCK